MATTNAISITAYRIERGSADAQTNYVVWSYQELLDVRAIDKVVPVNSAGGEDLAGLGWLYSKVVKKQFGTDQEFYTVHSIADMLNKINA